MLVKSLAWFSLLLALPACRVSGSGKLPNVDWKPTRNKTPLTPVPDEFLLSGVDIRLLRVTWVEEVSYILVRIPDRREYELEIEGVSTCEDHQRLGQLLMNTPVKVLDRAGEEIRHEGMPLHFRGPRSPEGTYALQAHYLFSIDDRRPACLVVGGQRVRLGG